MITYYSVRDEEGAEIKAFDTVEEAEEFCEDHNDRNLTIVEIVM